MSDGLCAASVLKLISITTKICTIPNSNEIETCET